MQKINTMEVTSQITWELKPPFTVNLVHLVRSVCSVQPVHSIQRELSIVRCSTLGKLDSRSFLLLAAIAVVEEGLFDVDFTSYIKPHNTCSGDIEDTHKV